METVLATINAERKQRKQFSHRAKAERTRTRENSIDPFVLF
jgi:hypothetical protein